MKKVLPIFLLLISLGLFLFTINDTSKKIGEEFPGYLTFENGVVGAFYVSDWVGIQQGLKYHDVPKLIPTSFQTFTKKDFFLVSLLPAISGLFFILLGLGIFFYLPTTPGRYPLLWFHSLGSIYLILCPDFHITYKFSYLLMVCFALIPSTMIHFSLLFPEEQKKAKQHHWLYFAPYIASLILMIPYLGLFHHPIAWIRAEYFAFSYMIFAYLFLLLRLFQTFQKPQLEINRIIARYLFIGQISAFTLPLICAVVVFIGGISFPLNLATPMALLFPIAVFMGVILGRLQQSQMQLVQMEKKAAVGNLLAGLAHEINNPMTFIYSAIEPLRESLNVLKSNSTEEKLKTELIKIHQLVDVMEEGATRAKNIVESFRYFSYAGQAERKEANLHEIMDQSIRLLEPQWKNRITFKKNYGDLPLFPCFSTEMGQVFINILSNACHAISGEGQITITTHADSKGLEISITDSGIGMTKEILAKIFDPFYTTKNQGEGSGLGLAITLEIIKKHGGTIDVKSEHLKGTCFILRLPNL